MSAAALLLVSGCTAPSDEATQSGLEVTSAFYALDYVTAHLMGEHGSLTSLQTPGQDSHDVELTAKQTIAIAQADLVVYLDGFQPAVDDAIESAAPQRVLDVTGSASLLPLEHDHEHEHAEPVDDHAHDDHDDHDDHDEHAHDDHDDHDEHAHDDHDDHALEHDDHAHDEHDEQAHEHDDHDHEHGDLDPHFWLDPLRLSAVAETIATELSAADPAHSEIYTENLRVLQSELSELDQEFTQGLASCQHTSFITSHAAFGYLGHRYGLKQIPIAGLSTHAEPSPARIAEVQKLAAEHDVSTVFFEPLTSPAIAQSIAGDLGLATATLDPLEGISEASEGSDYLEIMRNNLQALRDANGCR